MKKDQALTAESLQVAFKSAAVGAVLEATLTPLRHVGNVEVTYNWIYSALNCSRPSDFAWTINKLNETQISLSPKIPYQGKTLFASVRPDLDYTLQVQAPFSSDWITAVGANEIITMTTLQFLTVTLQGLNGLYITVSSIKTIAPQDGPHSGYKLHSNSQTVDDSSKFFIGVDEVLQSGLALPLKSQLTDVYLSDVLKHHGLPAGDSEVAEFRTRTMR